MSDPDELRQQANQVSASGTLGKPGALSRLFEYLLAKSLAGETPKELEIAFEVFGKDHRFDVSQDSVVRVYVHKLRRRLDDYYAGLPGPWTARIAIPKGEYRLMLERGEAPVNDSPAGSNRPARLWRKPLLTAAALAIGIIAGALLTLLFMPTREDAQLRAVRDSPIWAPLLKDELPITIVVGDYYMLGETDQSNDIRRLVREFSINSSSDFVQQVEVSPGLMERYRNLNFTYLPTSVAFALQDVIPVLSARKPLRMVLMSELKGSQLSDSHLVYIGFFSGMGVLVDPTLAASRIAIGGTYDEIVDLQADASYMSTAAAADTGDSRYMDYGFLSTFPGPGRNRVVVIAGTRDTGLMHMAEAATKPASVADIAERAGAADSFESLFEVYGVARAGMNSKLLFVSPLDTTRVWAMER